MTEPRSTATPEPPAPLLDRLGRPLRDLRISVTDRCNFRCRYCMPREVFGADFAFLPRNEILSFEEIERLARIFAQQGVTKLRLTGGEPLLRAELPKLIERLVAVPGIEDIALTTNASLLATQAQALADAGLRRITVSLDSLDDEVFRSMNDVNFPVDLVLAGIEAAAQAGLGPVKVNAVIRKGVNDHTLVDMARHFHGSGHVLRFIEFMDVGATNGWQMNEVVSGAEIIRRIAKVLPLEPIEADYRGEVANRWRYTDGGGEVGVITSVTEPFCGDCTRARLSAEGSLYTCLFATAGVDFREALRSGATDDDLTAMVRGVWGDRRDRYSALRTANTGSGGTGDVPGSGEGGDDGPRRVEMSYIGG